MIGRLSTRYLGCGRKPDPRRFRTVEECSGQLAVRRYLAGDVPPDLGRVGLTETQPHFGGVRAWFACPGCRRRCGVLYQPDPGAPWRCRCCHRLSYRSAQHAHRDEALWVANARIDRHLAANQGWGDDPAALFAGLGPGPSHALARALVYIDIARLEAEAEAEAEAAGAPDPARSPGPGHGDLTR